MSVTNCEAEKHAMHARVCMQLACDQEHINYLGMCIFVICIDMH